MMMTSNDRRHFTEVKTAYAFAVSGKQHKGVIISELGNTTRKKAFKYRLSRLVQCIILSLTTIT